MNVCGQIVYAQDCEPQHGFGKTNIHNIPVFDSRFKDRTAFCFVRNPLSWYKSYFGYRQITPWVPDSLRLDMLCESKDFNEFIEKVIHHFKYGYCTRLFEFFSEHCLWKGTQENLKRDLIMILEGLNVDFDESKITDDKINDSDSSKYEYTPEQERKIRMIERKTFERYGY